MDSTLLSRRARLGATEGEAGSGLRAGRLTTSNAYIPECFDVHIYSPFLQLEFTQLYVEIEKKAKIIPTFHFCLMS
jgi:hypothetical protein